MKPVLFSELETAFDTNGIGVLSDAISCYVDQELNGKFELEIRYPVMGRLFKELTDRTIILATVDPISRPQPFRIYRRLPSSGGISTCYARHIAYDLAGIPVSPCSATSAAAAMNSLKNNAAVDCPFTLTTDKATAGAFSVTTPKPLWKCLGGEAGSVLDVYGGEYEFDRFNVILHNRRGADRGVTVRYGKNLTTLEQDANCANCHTGVYPYWVGTDDTLVELPEKILRAEGTYNYTKILTLDCSNQWDVAPTEEQLRTYATTYMSANKIGVPDVSWKIEFVNLEQTEEYKGRALLERILPGDSVSIVFPDLNVDATARASAARWDVLMDRYVYVNLGSVKANLAKTIAQQKAELERKPSVSLVQAITMKLTAAILGAKGGAVRLLDTDGDEMPDTLYVADNPNPELAKKVWRWNYAGWAGSKNGYNGPFTVGATLEDGLLASAVTAASLVAGTITSADDGKTFFLDLDNGVLRMNATELTINGESVSAMATSAANTAVSNWSQTDLFNKLTNNGTIKGIYMKDGQLYINATYLATGILSSADGKTFYLDLDNGVLKMQATELSISGKSVQNIADESSEAAADAALVDAKSYADNKASSTLSSAKSYADSAASAAAEAVADDFSSQQKIFNILTNNGQTQGIFLKDGKIYINMEYLAAGQIDADRFTLRGLFEVRGISTAGNEFLGGYIGYKSGSLDNGVPTDGIMLAGPDMLCHVISTGSGVRMQAGDIDIHVTKQHAVINGPLEVNGDITYSGTLTPKT